MSASARLGVATASCSFFVTRCIPSSSKETVYCPGGIDGKLYPPPSPVTAVRIPCSEGDAIVTVTPGSAFPSVVTVPLSDDVVPTPCASALPAIRSTAAKSNSLRGIFISFFLLLVRDRTRKCTSLAVVRWELTDCKQMRSLVTLESALQFSVFPIVKFEFAKSLSISKGIGEK
jgi:hypothetical protein